jgi:hypothetical protein
VEGILSWAAYPLATAEVAELVGVGLDEARSRLEQAGALLTPVASDGYVASDGCWSPGATRDRSQSGPTRAVPPIARHLTGSEPARAAPAGTRPAG